MKKISYLLLVFAIFLMAMKADKQAYRLFDQSGKKATYAKMFKQALESDIILFGEQHNNPICHWMQYEITSDLFEERGEDLIIGAEMFERDQQLILSEYVFGIISASSFKSQIRLWPNYKTDYKPLVEFAKENNIPFIATNIPRRYASIVYHEGFEGIDSISSHAKMFMAKLPIPYDPELPGYKSMYDMNDTTNTHGSPNLPKAQAIKDASMAHFILQSLEDGKTFIHYHGSFHSDNYEGIMWYLNEYRPGLKIMTIASIEQESTEKLTEDNEGLADYILVIPETMTKTY